jgi:hypothetical protein
MTLSPAVLTASKMGAQVNSAEDLAKQTKIKYGTYCCGSTNAFFQSSTIPTYQKLNAFMEGFKPSVYTSGNDAGRDRVRKEDGLYAFFMEAAAIEYNVEQYCDLRQIGGLLDSKGYGIALPKGEFSPPAPTPPPPRLALHPRHLRRRAEAAGAGRAEEAEEEVVVKEVWRAVPN